MGPVEAKITEEDLKRLFKDVSSHLSMLRLPMTNDRPTNRVRLQCGLIRECNVKTLGDRIFAMIEFMDKVSLDCNMLLYLCKATDCVLWVVVRPGCANQGQEKDQRRGNGSSSRLAVLPLRYQLSGIV